MPNDREKFQELLGDDLPFLNKDDNQDELFLLRKRVIEHADECKCNDCQELNLLKQLGLG